MVKVIGKPKVQGKEQSADEALQKITNVGTSSMLRRIKAELKLKDIVTYANVGEHLDKETLEEIGNAVVEGYRVDRSSRNEWEERNAEGLKLAMQLKEEKSFPWENCANIKIPLITIAALQFLARVSILTKGKYPVKFETIGVDPMGEGYKQCQRLGKHLSLQITEEDSCWMDEDEKCKLGAALVGAAFKKTFFDPVANVVKSEYVPAEDFVVDYYAKDLQKANRVTHVLKWTRNDILERERGGLFLEMSDTPPNPTTETNELATASDEIAGTRASGDDNAELYTILEQHIWLDLDGDDYAEPYIAFVRIDTKETLRVVARFFDEGDVVRKNDGLVRKLEQKRKAATDLQEAQRLQGKIDDGKLAKDNHILRIQPVEFFTKYTFIPSPDGSFYDLGLIALLGALNESCNSIINQLVDSGTMQTTAGGFLGRGVKIKGGQTSFSPFEWKPVDSTGDDLRKNIFPLPVREPAAVLLQLLQFLMSYGEKVSGATDIMTGISPGQNTPAETSRNTIEQGMKIFSGIFFRMHRAFSSELKKFVVFNKLYLSQTPQWPELTDGVNAIITPKDYIGTGFRVFPAADPQMVSESQRQSNAQLLIQASNSSPGYNKYLVNKELLEAYNVSNIDNILPDPEGKNAIQPPPNPKMEIEKGKLDLLTKKFQLEQQKFQADQQTAQLEMQQEAMKTGAEVLMLQAKATQLLSEAEGAEAGHQIALINAQIGAAKLHQDRIFRSLAVMQKSIDQRQHAAKEGIASAGAEQGADKAGRAAAGVAGVDQPPADAGAAQQPQGQPA